MTAPLTHTAPVPLPAKQEPARVRTRSRRSRCAAGSATSASAHGRGTDRSAAYPSAETAANTPIRPRDDARPVGTGDQPGTSHPEPHCRPTPPGARRGLAGGGYAVFGPQAADSLPFFSLEGPLRGTADTLWRDAPAEAVFGPASTSFQPASCRGPAPSLTENPSFRASCCCSPQPTPCCSTAIWATYGCC